jgi:uncharacterized protein (TIGR01244 family)
MTMDTRQITPDYHVAPQITPEDAAALKNAGFVRVICNRPDGEIPPALQAEAMRIAVEAAGLEFFALPLTHQTMTPDNVALQKTLVAEAGGPVLAYCASGTRCSVIWALGEAGHRPVDEILNMAAQAGYDLTGLAGALQR